MCVGVHVGVQLCMCVHVCMCMGTQVGCAHLCACACGSLRLVLGIISHPFSTLYIETGFLIQNQRFNQTSEAEITDIHMFQWIRVLHVMLSK